MRTYHKIVALALVLMLAVVPLCLAASEDSDAYSLKSVEVVRGFTDQGEGSIAVYITNGTSSPVTVTIKVDAANGTRSYATKEFTIPANTTTSNVKDSDRHAEVSFSFEGSGHKEIKVTVTGGGDTQTLIKDIDVPHSIWSDWTTYVVIIIVIIFIIVVVWLRMRSVSDAKKENKKEKVFTQMAEEKKAKKQAAQQQTIATEPAKKKIYEGSKRRKQ
ncbi:MAG: hypothetical protein IJT54_00090 [Candidatus Methanomethylophilaceae archaeon]|nr:hypothetical protein [Candidatus Methanomethylophilaceae archaeon]